MFGKSYNTIGDHNANTCLSTAGDIIIKTPNRFVTIFKNGKLAVDDSSEIFTVSSEDDMKKTGVYIVSSTDENGEETQSVYLYVDGTKILLTSNSDGYISYTAAQELKPEQFIQAMKNLGVYFQTLDEAKAAGLTEGLVYILEDQKLYKIVDGEFTDIAGGTGGDSDNSDGDTSTEPEAVTSLQIGGIFIDGESNTISADDLIIQAGGSDYIWFKNDQVFVKKDLIISKQNVLMLEGSEEETSGFLVYTKDDEAYLEVDNLIVHNSSPEYEPQIYSTYIGTLDKNQIQDANWKSAPTDISLVLKYQSKFAVGDYVLVQTAGGNQVTVEAKTIELATDDGQEKTVQRIQATLESAPMQDVSLEVVYSYPVDNSSDTSGDDDSDSDSDSDDGDGDDGDSDGDANNEITGTVQILIPATVINEDTGEPEPNTYGESADIEGIPTIEEITSVKVLSGDADIFYGDSGGHTMPAAFIGTVTSANPLEINLPTQDNPAGSVLTNLKDSPIYKIGDPTGTVHILFHSSNSISLRECTVEDGTLVMKTTTQIGDLSAISKPQPTSSTDPAEQFEGNGIYSDNFIGVNPKFYGGTFEGVEGTEYPVYGDSLNFPEEGFDDPQYDKVIPCIGWVKKLIEQSG